MEQKIIKKLAREVSYKTVDKGESLEEALKVAHYKLKRWHENETKGRKEKIL
ncbi:hypothetical protein [Clostridium ihumii]|uniref:hypothetical protein n=1 Tax=Clostridium ihumii TaxID=1470356 RepID=UPI003D357530